MKSQQEYARAANDVAPEDPAGESPSALEDLVWVAARAMDVPIAVIVLDTAATIGSRTLVAAAADDPWVRNNATIDFARLADPRLAADHGLAFYAAVPLRRTDDATIGTLAVLARNPRVVSEDDLATLKRLARLVTVLCASSPDEAC